MKERKSSESKHETPEPSDALADEQLEEVAGGVWGDPHVELKKRVSADLEEGIREKKKINGIRMP